MHTFEQWTKAQAVRFMIYQKNPASTQHIENLHIVSAKADGRGNCAPTAQTTLCGKVDIKELVPFNGQCYEEKSAREAACFFGRGFCGQCAATLYADKP
ncbi:MAG: hypothetical protein KKF77_03530 [Proteobacteria bacterium]|nr:hypothetical protein [Pseudomonadota bacterium]